MNIEYESKRYDRLILKYPKSHKICKLKRRQLLNLTNQLARLKAPTKVIKLVTKVSQESELDLFYNNIVEHG